MRGTHGWAEVSRERKREIIDAIVANTPTTGPVHAELDLTDRCNVACYFCNQQDLRTKEQIPIQKTTELIDELAATGLRSVRLSGGGDPLFHREINDVLAHLAKRGIVVDNLTTNGVALNHDIAGYLVNNKAREVIFSLNAVDAADYARMMKVKPALFDKVITAIKTLVAVRGDSIYPSIVLQFLLDRSNITRIVEMYDLGRSLGVDRIAVNAVLEIPRERIDRELLLRPEDAELAEPHVEQVLRKDADAGLLQIDFAVYGWNKMMDRVRARAGTVSTNMYPTAPSFRERNGACFFAWYTAAVTGNGDIRPCCLLLNPDVPPLGNVHEKSMSEHWRGPAFQKMRDEMREVLLRGGKVEYDPKRFTILKEVCVKPGLCWLKNMYFRVDEEFYAELDAKLEKVRRKEVRWLGTPKQIKRRAGVFLYDHPKVKDLVSGDRLRRTYDWLRDSTRPLRVALKRHLHINLTDAA
ncbi:MAG TPA: radical SAM protein [Thermoanaerobaculia bacterium]|jgi:MoaA/NifB/PqqE/SkfB family radical SAM enzyme|nr:radical SAM protein [Thermoanaerobaculia bacterium]